MECFEQRAFPFSTSSLIEGKISTFRFVSSVLPPGSQGLKGDEVDVIVKFKNALGMDDPEAAAMHMEVLLVACVLHMFQFITEAKV